MTDGPRGEDGECRHGRWTVYEKRLRLAYRWVTLADRHVVGWTSGAVTVITAVPDRAGRNVGV